MVKKKTMNCDCGGGVSGVNDGVGGGDKERQITQKGTINGVSTSLR